MIKKSERMKLKNKYNKLINDISRIENSIEYLNLLNRVEDLEDEMEEMTLSLYDQVDELELECINFLSDNVDISYKSIIGNKPMIHKALKILFK